MKAKHLLLLLLLALLTLPARAVTDVTITVTAVAGADGYHVYDRQTVGGVFVYTKVATITAGTVVTVYNFAPGTHSLIYRAYSTAGGEAALDSTGVATFTVASAPGAGTAIAVTTTVR
jgi:hypothetical protein